MSSQLGRIISEGHLRQVNGKFTHLFGLNAFNFMFQHSGWRCFHDFKHTRASCTTTPSAHSLAQFTELYSESHFSFTNSVILCFHPPLNSWVTSRARVSQPVPAPPPLVSQSFHPGIGKGPRQEKISHFALKTRLLRFF